MFIVTRIKVSNFHGIKDSVEVDFTEGGSIPKIGYFNYSSKKRVSLVSGFYGANASGKSTILNAFDVIIGLMFSRHINESLDDALIVVPNFHNDFKDEWIVLEIDFMVNENKYEYAFSIKNQGKEIASEELKKNNNIVFNRNGNNIIFNEKIQKEIKNLIKESFVAPTKSTFLSVLLQDISLFNILNETIGIDELKQINKKVCFITDRRSTKMNQNNRTDIYRIPINYIQYNNQETEQDFHITNTIIQYFEDSFDTLVVEDKGSGVINYAAKYKNFYKDLNVMDLSAGTREVIAYISDIVKILKTGGIVVYDETSKYYHPDMEIAILNLFKDKNINKHHAQIFFSSHNHETLDLLHNHQAHILEKKNGQIILNKISDYDVKERDNIKRLYRLGSFNGIPDTIDFNRFIHNLF